ncbi:MAG: HAD family hydrolase [Spirochaetota bacterium]
MNIDNITTIILDFDYTMADSSKYVVECMNYAIDKMDLPPSTEDAICRTIGSTLENAFKQLYESKFTKKKAMEFITYYKERADILNGKHIQLFKFVPDTIIKLYNAGYTLGIVSTRNRYRIEQILERLGFLDYFKTIVGGEDVFKHKPDPESLNKAINNLNISKDECLYVGDNVIDAMTGENAGVTFIGVLSGKTRKEEFEKYPNFKILNNVSELVNIKSIRNRISKSIP